MNNPIDINGLQQQIDQLKEQENYAMGAIQENPDIDKWEMDISVHLDRLKAKLLGMTQDGTTWKQTSKAVMNEEGTARLMVEIETRVSIHMEMSELDKHEIDLIVGDAGLAIGDLLEDNWKQWDINETSLSSELNSIGTMFEHTLTILLNIAKNGGMRRHREKRGIKQYSPQAPQPAMSY